MCRSKIEDNGRRCNGHTPYGIERRNLQAQKQYHISKLAQEDLTDKQRARSERKLDATQERLDSLLAEKKALGRGRAHVMELTPKTQQVIDQLTADGLTPYIVGGSVRDQLMGLDSKDIDIEVYGGTPEEVAASLRKLGQVDDVGASFGVLKIALGSEDFDVSLPRTDSKVGDSHTDFEVEVDPNLSLYEATSRRDFTINALMYSPKLGYIVDQHSGLKDLENKQLRHVSDAFDEDPLRVLRGVQMASRFDMELHPDTIIKAQTLKDGYNQLAVERVQIEFQKLYEKGNSPEKAFKLLKATGWENNFSGLAAINDERMSEDLTRTQANIDLGVIPKDKRTLILSAAITKRMNPDDRYSFLSATTVGSDTKNASHYLASMEAPANYTSAAELRQWAYDMPRQLSIRDWTMLESSVGNQNKAYEVLELASKNNLNILDGAEPDLLRGDDIMKLFPGRRPGPWMKENLAIVRSAQYADVFRNYLTGLDWAKKNLT